MVTKTQNLAIEVSAPETSALSRVRNCETLPLTHHLAESND